MCKVSADCIVNMLLLICHVFGLREIKVFVCLSVCLSVYRLRQNDGSSLDLFQETGTSVLLFVTGLIMDHFLWIYFALQMATEPSTCFIIVFWLFYSGPEVINFFSCSTQLSMIISLLINIKMPTMFSKKAFAIISNLRFISRTNFIKLQNGR